MVGQSVLSAAAVSAGTWIPRREAEVASSRDIMVPVPDMGPAPHALLAADLLQPGWGGDLTEEEYLYIRYELERNPKLRTLWGFKRGRGYKLSEEAIRQRALHGVEPPPVIALLRT